MTLVVLMIKNYVLLICCKKKCFIAKCLFKKYIYFISAELIQLLSLVFKMEIFDRSAGLLLDLSFLILPINVTCT